MSGQRWDGNISLSLIFFHPIPKGERKIEEEFFFNNLKVFFNVYIYIFFFCAFFIILL